MTSIHHHNQDGELAYAHNLSIALERYTSAADDNVAVQLLDTLANVYFPINYGHSEESRSLLLTSIALTSGNTHYPGIIQPTPIAFRRWEDGPPVQEDNGVRAITNAIKDLRLDGASDRDKRIAARLQTLSLDAQSEDQPINAPSVRQFLSFFRANRHVNIPKITLTPDGNLSVRWLNGPTHFFAIQFTGRPLVQIVAKAPRTNASTAEFFVLELVSHVRSFADTIGVTLG